MSPTKLLTYKSYCFLTSAFISLLKVSNFDLSLLLPVFFAFACVLFLLRILLLISGVIQGTEDTDLLISEGYAYQQTLEQRKLSNQNFPELSDYPWA